MLPIVLLFFQTLILWCAVFFLYKEKKRITLIPLYSLIAVCTLLTHNLADLGFSITWEGFYFFVASVSFFTTVMLGELILYLLEGPRAVRLGLTIILGVSLLYVGVVILLNWQIDTSKWIKISWESLNTYFWSILAIIIDIFSITIIWELLARVKKIPLFLRIFLVIFTTYALDSFIFTTGAFSASPFYLSILKANLSVRLGLAIITTPVISIFLKMAKYSDAGKNRPVKFWEIFNFRSDLETRIRTMSEVLTHEKELVEELKKFQMSVEAASDQIVISDKEGIVIYANPMMEELTGYTRKEALGKKAGTLWGKQMEKNYYEKMWKTIKDQKSAFVGELTNKKKDGTHYDASLKISPVLDESKNVKYFVAVERDISKERELDRMKDEFLSMASHELRTPLTAIDGIVSMMRDGDYGKINEELKSPLKDIEMAAERLIMLVNDLLSASRIEAGRLKFELSEFDITAEIEKTIRLLKVVSEPKGINLKMNNSLKIIVQADKNKIEEIINNLIGNSIKFTDRGEISVDVVDQKERVVIKINDTGIGIKKEDRDKVFLKFKQLDSGSGRPPGTGLGLYISKELCKKMGGDLWLEKSEIGKGSTFAFSIPIQGSNCAKITAEKIAKEAKTNPSQKSDLIQKA